MTVTQWLTFGALIVGALTWLGTLIVAAIAFGKVLGTVNSLKETANNQVTATEHLATAVEHLEQARSGADVAKADMDRRVGQLERSGIEVATRFSELVVSVGKLETANELQHDQVTRSMERLSNAVESLQRQLGNLMAGRGGLRVLRGRDEEDDRVAAAPTSEG